MDEDVGPTGGGSGGDLHFEDEEGEDEDEDDDPLERDYGADDSDWDRCVRGLRTASGFGGE